MAITEAQRLGIVSAAEALIGVPYVWAGNAPPGMDCSGSVQWLLRVNGVEPWYSMYPHSVDMTAAMLYDQLQPLESDEWPWPGDLAFYGRTKITHVVVITQTDGAEVKRVISASGGGPDCVDVVAGIAKGASLKPFNSALYRSDFRGYRRPWLKEGA